MLTAPARLLLVHLQERTDAVAMGTLRAPAAGAAADVGEATEQQRRTSHADTEGRTTQDPRSGSTDHGASTPTSRHILPRPCPQRTPSAETVGLRKERRQTRPTSKHRR